MVEALERAVAVLALSCVVGLAAAVVVVVVVLAVPHEGLVVSHELMLELPTRPAVVLEARDVTAEVRTLPDLARSAQSVL